MTSNRDCYVYIVPPGETSFVTAGRFQTTTTDGVATGRFVYRRRYRERPDAVELDPAELLLTDGVFETTRMDGFFGAIRDAMPDHWGRLVIERRSLGPLEEFDYLLQGQDDRAGALGFGFDLAPPATPAAGRSFATPRQLGDLQRQAEAVLAGDTGSHASAEHLLLLGTSMGGARPKVVVEDGGALWLAKLPRPDDRWNQPRVEAGVLALARACGISAATGRIHAVGENDALLVRRFDRERAEDGYRRARMARSGGTWRWSAASSGAGPIATICSAPPGAFCFGRKTPPPSSTRFCERFATAGAPFCRRPGQAGRIAMPSPARLRTRG